MKIAISPCPNDTFLFHPWIAGWVGKPPEVTFADIQELNTLADSGDYPLIKISCASLKRLSPLYELLPVGAALGYNCGPKLISKTPFSLEDLHLKRIAVPGKETTAYLLLKHLLPPPRATHFCLYHEVIEHIEQDSVDCGIIIHETRFTYASYGLCEIVDLGELWHTRYHLPLPLGCLVLRRDFPEKESLVQTLLASLAYARSYPEKSLPFILEHSQEKDPQIVKQHIATYVNSETEMLSPLGRKAIKILCLES